MNESNKKRNVSTGHLLGNRKVAQSRGDGWKTKLLAGKHEAQFNPSALRLLRLKKNVNQAGIASQIGVSLASYGSIERGKRLVSKDRARIISKKLGQSVDKLFLLKDDDKYLAVI